MTGSESKLRATGIPFLIKVEIQIDQILSRLKPLFFQIESMEPEMRNESLFRQHVLKSNLQRPQKP